MNESVAIGIDLGGTNLKAAVVDAARRILARRTLLIVDHDPDSVVAEMVGLVDQLLSRAGVERSALVGVGVGAPGPLSRKTGRIIQSPNLPGWVDYALRDVLQERLAARVVLDNDGNVAAFGEYWAGFADACQDLVMLTLGTGVGGGVVIGGRILHGYFDSAAELGHMIVVLDGLPCPCGQRGCLEQYASAGGVARRVTAAIQAGESGALADEVHGGRPITAEQVAAGARDGDSLCLRIWDEACRYLAVACINIQHTYNPACVLLGGGMSRAGAFLLDRVTEFVTEQRWSLHDDVPAIKQANLGYDAGVVGAAGLVWSTEDETDGVLPASCR